MDAGLFTRPAEPQKQMDTPDMAPMTTTALEVSGHATPPAKPAASVPQPIVRLGIAPTTLEEGWRLAQMFAKSELVPKAFRGRPEDIMVCIQYGLEIGLPPMAALSSIAVINGRASLWGDGFIAVLMSSPLYEDHDEYYEVSGVRKDRLTADDLKQDATTAVCTFWRQGKRTPVTRAFSIAQAKKAGLWGKAGPWQEYGDRMLSMRARGFAGRDAFPDLLRGIKTAEEVMDTPPDIDVRPIAVAAPAAPARPEGYDAWVSGLVAAANGGNAALSAAWKIASAAQRRYMLETDPASWDSLKARADSVDQQAAVAVGEVAE
jgi:hypothetical protein